MDDSTDKTEIRNRVAACIGPEAFNRLVETAPDTRKKGRLRFWQEQLFQAIAKETGITVGTLDRYIELFLDAGLLPIQLPPLTKKTFLEDPNRLWYSLRRAEIQREWFIEAWHTLPAFRNNLTYERPQRHKNGDFFIASDLLAFLPQVLSCDEVVAAYKAIRRESGRSEGEWRAEFERAFPLCMDALPQSTEGEPESEG